MERRDRNGRAVIERLVRGSTYALASKHRASAAGSSPFFIDSSIVAGIARQSGAKHGDRGPKRMTVEQAEGYPCKGRASWSSLIKIVSPITPFRALCSGALAADALQRSRDKPFGRWASFNSVIFMAGRALRCGRGARGLSRGTVKPS